MIYKSNDQTKVAEFIAYYKRHPFKYIKFIEDSVGVKLKLYQKILLFIPTKEQRRQKRVDKVLKKFINKH